MEQATSDPRISIINVRSCGMTPYFIVVVRATIGSQKYQGEFKVGYGCTHSFLRHYPRSGEFPNWILDLMRMQAIKEVN